jgi:hypothetical protein
MHQLSLYSGNMTNVPWGAEIAGLPSYDPRDYVRMYTNISLATTAGLRGIWQYLLIIASVLVGMLAFTSATMHFVQRMRRQSLRHRIESGEVNLEALGIKRLTVPRAFIVSLPLFTYDSEDGAPSQQSFTSKQLRQTVYERHISQRSSSRQDAARIRYPTRRLPPSLISEESILGRDNTPSHNFLPESHGMCAICLDDFKSGVTRIRGLPCGHIFHPECIDSFLGNHSSLCPMCKANILPPGYCPAEITNAMVQRERRLRRLRSRITVANDDNSQDSVNSMAGLRKLTSRVKNIILDSPRSARHTESQVPLQTQQPLMTGAVSGSPNTSILGNEVLERPNPRGSRDAITQQRIRELAGQLTFVEDEEIINGRRRSYGMIPVCS